MRRSDRGPTESLSVRESSELLCGFANTGAGRCDVVHIESRSASVTGEIERVGQEIAHQVRSAGSRGVLCRGMGRSYGDAAHNSGGRVLMARSETLEIEKVEDGFSVLAPGGVGLEVAMAGLVHAGGFVPVTPGTRQVTIAGAVASDVHGKNHHVASSFANHVQQLYVVDGSGELVVLEPTDPRFAANVGGMGLCGAIVGVRFFAPRVTVPALTVHTTRTIDLASTLAALRERDTQAEFSVAWVDLTAPRGALGRGVVQTANWMGERDSELSCEDAARRAVAGLRSARVALPEIGVNLMRAPLTKLFNTLWWHHAPLDAVCTQVTPGRFFHPLDAVGNWNAVYGKQGMVQHQFVVPDGAEHVIELALGELGGRGAGFLAVLKRFGASSSGLLSFPRPGWTLAVDVAARPELAVVLDRLDKAVLRASGRVYLAKDSRAAAGTIAAMYQETLPRFAEIAREMDPHGVFQSDLSRRLRLRDGAGPVKP